MKFEEKFLSLQAAEWRPNYLPYRRLKAMLKLSAKGGHPPSYEINLKDFMSAFRCALGTIKAFVDTQLLTLKGKESMVLEPYKRVRHGAASLAVEDEYLIYGELLEDYNRLHMFIRLNYEASQRINAKAEKFQRIFQTAPYCGLDGLIKEQAACERQCLTEVERLQRMISSTRQGSNTLPACNLMSLSEEYSNARLLLTTINNDILANQSINLSSLLGKLQRTPDIPKDIVDEVFNTSLTMSIICRSWSCTTALIEDHPEETRSLVNSSWLNGLLLAIFRHSRLSPISSHERDAQMRENFDPQNLCMKLFNLILNHAGMKAKDLLITPDAAGAISLQYSAQLGLPMICDFIIKYIERLGISPKSAILAASTTGITPLQWSVARGHVHVTRIFLDALYVGIDEVSDNILNDLLAIAIEYQNDELVQLLASQCTVISQISSNGETCLHVASRVGRRDYVDTILEITSQQNSAIDVQEEIYGWTPLTIASTRGHLPIVETLLRAGANELLPDYQGWTAKDHAAFKGHFAVLNRLKTNKAIKPSKNPCITTSPPNLMGDTSYLIVNLGTVQKGREINPLDLEHVSTMSGQLLPESALSLEISTSGGPAHILRLPLLRDLVDDTLIFPISDPFETNLVFKLLRNTSHSRLNNTLIGSGISLVSRKKDGNISHHKSLIRESTVPILEKETMELIGKITFTFFIATPFLGLNTRSSSFEYLEKTRSTQLIGHRGYGQNTADRGYLQLGENTIQSFMSAANLGASHVEFDVQLTRDLIPVLYHDLSLSESGTDVAIHDLTLKQFIHASDMQLSSKNDADNSRSRSRSLSRNHKAANNEARLRMKHTLYFSNNGYKPNTRGDFIQIPLATLEEALLNVPEEVGFDIELKYPRIHEAHAIEMAPIAIELNTFVDTILTLIARYAGSRNIILSSFTPEICILLVIKQKAYPIFFITNAGKLPVVDKEERAGSVQVAVRFATKWGLAGVVFASDVILMCPRLVNYVKNKGLVCATYGPLNNIPESVELQAKSGVDLLVADRVALVSKTLKSLE